MTDETTAESGGPAPAAPLPTDAQDPTTETATPSSSPVPRPLSPAEMQPPLSPEMDAALNPVDAARLRALEARRAFEMLNADEPWMDDYFTLLEEGWSPRQAMYMLWEAQPQPRTPATQIELAREVLGLTSDRVIREWKAANPMMKSRIVKLVGSALGKARANILAALVESASNPSYRHAQDRKVALEILNIYVPRQMMSFDLPTTPDEIEEADTETLRTLAQQPVTHVKDPGDE